MRALTWRGWALVVASALLAGLIAAAAWCAPAAFGGKFELVPLQHDCPGPKGVRGHAAPHCPLLVNGHQYYALRNSLTFPLADGRIVTAPKGFQTDLASIPQALWAVLPPDGEWAEPAVFHDLCYKTRGTMRWLGIDGLPRGPPLTREQCDRELLHDGMVADHVTAWKRIAITEAVRVGGSGGWGH